MSFKVCRSDNFDKVVALCQFLAFCHFLTIRPRDVLFYNKFDVMIILIMVRFCYIDY